MTKILVKCRQYADLIEWNDYHVIFVGYLPSVPVNQLNVLALCLLVFQRKRSHI